MTKKKMNRRQITSSYRHIVVPKVDTERKLMAMEAENILNVFQSCIQRLEDDNCSSGVELISAIYEEFIEGCEKKFQLEISRVIVPDDGTPDWLRNDSIGEGVT